MDNSTSFKLGLALFFVFHIILFFIIKHILYKRRVRKQAKFENDVEDKKSEFRKKNML